ncbi:MAG: hypothetical protein H0T71_08455 [Acidobacteria bacterium]|nr:hypothetical protein [Acidobacteriota bacterium]
MSDTWAGVLAVSVAVMALVQVAVLAGLALAGMKLMAAIASTQQQVEALAADLKLRVAAVTERVNAVADDVRGVTARVQQVATTVSDGVTRVEETVRTAGHRVQTTIDQVPPSVKKGVPAGLAILAALKTVQQVRKRMKDDRGADDDVYAATS